MSEQQEIFDLSEVSSISCVCAQCETEIIFKVGKAKHLDPEGSATGNAGKRCPNCGASLYPLDEILASFQQAYGKAGSSELRMRLRTAPIKSTRPTAR
jgi:hypothetical protein